MTIYKIGTGIANVTDPALELYMAGMSDPRQKTKGVETNLYARAFIIVDPKSKKRVVIVSADIWTATQVIKTEVIKKLKKSKGNLYNDDNVLISGTHTHSGPAGYSHNKLYDPSPDPVDKITRGFNHHTFVCIVSGIVQAIENAHANLKSGKIYVNTGMITEDCGNQRSEAAYNNNPKKERDKYKSKSDREMLLLKFVRLDEAGNPTLPIGTINWYPIHPTDRGQFNLFVSGDNKGEASRLFELEMGTDYSVTDTFVAAFANSNCGDVSGNVKSVNGKFKAFVPNWETANDVPIGGDLTVDQANMIVHGKAQYEKAKDLFCSATKDPLSKEENELSGSVDYRHTRVDMANIDLGENKRTYPPALGASFAAGSSEDSVPEPSIGLKEGIITEKISESVISVNLARDVLKITFGLKKAAQVSPDWGSTETMTSMNGLLYIIQGGILWEKDPNKKAREISSGWGGTQAMTSMNGLLYIIQGGTLWEKDPNKKAREISTGWDGTQAMTAMNGLLYIVQGGTLWEKNPKTNTAARKISTGWDGTQAMTAMNNLLYIAQGGALWERDPSNRKKTWKISTDWDGVQAMTGLNGHLYIVQANILWDHFEQGHWPKPIIFNLAAGETPLVPNILPIQILKIGNLVITGVPGELTTMAGRRLKKTVLDELQDSGADHLALGTYANDYSQYITTREEYEKQHYEGASTLFGPYTLEAYQQEFKKLAEALKNGTEVPKGPAPQKPSSDDNRRVTIRNESDKTINVKLYKDNDNTRSRTLPNGNLTLRAKTERAYFLPGDVKRAAVYVNGGLKGAVMVGHLFLYPSSITFTYFPPAHPQTKLSTIRPENNVFCPPNNGWLQPILQMMLSEQTEAMQAVMYMMQDQPDAVQPILHVMQDQPKAIQPILQLMNSDKPESTQSILHIINTDKPESLQPILEMMNSDQPEIMQSILQMMNSDEPESIEAILNMMNVEKPKSKQGGKKDKNKDQEKKERKEQREKEKREQNRKEKEEQKKKKERKEQLEKEKREKKRKEKEEQARKDKEKKERKAQREKAKREQNRREKEEQKRRKEQREKEKSQKKK